MDNNSEALAICQRTVTKVRTEVGKPLTLQLASVIRAEARARRDLELGRDTINVGDLVAMQVYLGE